MMWWGNNGSWGWAAFLVMLVCAAMMVGMMRHDTSAHTRSASNRDEDAPERVLAKRLASGEIDVEEFERRRDALQRASLPPADELHSTER
jgi:uncharacterized membrane protein